MKRAAVATLALCAAIASPVAYGQRPHVPLMLPASDSVRQSFVRVINYSDVAGNVRITAIDDGGNVSGTVTIRLAADQTYHFNSSDLTDGNANKGIIDGNPLNAAPRNLCLLTRQEHYALHSRKG